MSDITPTTTRVANMYSFATAWDAEPDDPWVRKMQANARAEFNRWLAAHDREVKAEAWDQGYEWVDSYVEGDDEPRTIWDNPYRIEGQETP